jgi:hypothetical protein
MRIHQLRPTTGIPASNASESSSSTEAVGPARSEEPPPEAPSAALLLADLQRRYGPHIAETVRRARDLDVADPRPLSAPQIEAAQSVVETSQSVVSGFNVVPMMRLSANVFSSEFKSCAKAVGVDPDTLSKSSKDQIDALFAIEVAVAGAANTQWVDHDTAELLMQKVIEKVVLLTK